uniref:OCEL domain-containing protein n=1 Tax=Gasterosteus aculeatus aculeatus TaxID=481459 RepID=A0AAQ4NP17_GASAC
MCQAPQEASSSVCIRQQRPQAVHQQQEERRRGHANPEALEGAHHPPPGPQALQETRAAAVAGARKSRPEGQDRAGRYAGGGGKSESQRQQLPAEGRLLQACAEGLARLQRGGEAAHQQDAGQEVAATHWTSNHGIFKQMCPVLKTSEDTTLQHSAAKNPAAKRPVPFDLLEKPTVKRQRPADQKLQQQPTANGLLNNKGHDVAAPMLSPGFLTKTEFQRTSNHTESRDREPKVSSRQPPQRDSDCAHQQPANSQHNKKKSKKHKDKERERLKDNKASEWLETSPDLKQNLDKLDNPDITHAAASEEKPDYVLTYGTIVTLEQRRRYQEDFCAEYDEYKDLHSRIATITHMFVQLGSKIKSLSPGTQEYKIMEDQILEKYNKYRKKFPGYREEKKRCEYLHEKLSYIKQLIKDYDVSRASS